MAKKKYYAIRKGYIPGIYSSWSEAEAQVKGFSGAQFKGFSSEKDAHDWLDGKEILSQKRTVSKKKHVCFDNLDCGENDILVYTDGGAIGNPGPGGYGAVVIDQGKKHELQGGYRLTTNNRMELMACIVALRHLNQSADKIVLYSDSSYVVNGISRGWVKKWKINGWLTSNKNSVKNRDLWEELLALTQKLDVEFRWVKGHAGNPLNERCDKLAVQAARGDDLLPDVEYEASKRSELL